jgi:hypothetical protein
MFFILSPKDARRAVVALASHTSWALSELLELDGNELAAWIDVLPKCLGAKKSLTTTQIKIWNSQNFLSSS